MGIAQESNVNEDSIIQQLQIRERITYVFIPRANDSFISAKRLYNSKGLKKEDQYYTPNKIISSKIQYKYNTDGLLISTIIFKDGKVRSKSNNIYRNGKHTETLTTSLDRDLRSHKKLNYNNKGLLFEEHKKGASDQDFKLITRRYYNPDKSVKKIEYYNKKGKKDYVLLYVYDKEHNVYKVYKNRVSANRLERIVSHNNLGQTMEASYLKSNRRTSHKYNKHGLLTFKITYLNKQLNLISKFDYIQGSSDNELFQIRKL